MQLEFEGKEAVLQETSIPTENGGRIPLKLKGVKDGAGNVYYSAEVDGVQWFQTENITHGVILFAMMQKHITEYMHYESI